MSTTVKRRSAAAQLEHDLRWTIAQQQRVIRMLLTAAVPTKGPGVYILVSVDNEPLYVGQAVNVWSRLDGHRLVTFHRAIMLPEHDAAKRSTLEAYLIAMLKPPLNGNGGQRVKYDPELRAMFSNFPPEAFVGSA